MKFTSTQKKITFFIVLLSFLIRVIRLDIPHDWSFDEVYHALSAEAYALNDPRGYEWWNESPKDLAYEWLHPPVGKLLMAASIKLLARPYIPISKAALVDGATTFAWRFPGTIFAALTVLLLIRFGTKLCNNFWVGAVAGILYGLDGLSFVQSRTGMNDIFITYFVLLSFYRLYIFLTEYPKHTLKNLLMVGLSVGLAASTKWTGFYAVGIVFMWGVAYVLRKRNWKLLLPAFFSLAILPVIVYVASYGQWWLQGHNIQKFYELHQQIWWYQTGLKATHDYQSKAYTWPFLIRPVWFYVKYEDKIINSQKQLYIGNIYTMGNPLIWWAGIGAIGCLLWLIIKKDLAIFVLRVSGASKEASVKKFIKEGLRLGSAGNAYLLILVGYFGMFLPWIASPRIMFLYHYLPSIPFLCLGLAVILNMIKEKGKSEKVGVYAFLGLVVLTFIFFYPHWTGVLLPQEWNKVFYWLPTWK